MGSLGVTAIVPAYNEEKTVADVVSVLVSSGMFEDVLVVDDGSSDRTAAEAEHAGARVIVSEVNRGKGAAMSRGVAEAKTSVICFFDADLADLQTHHIESMLGPVSSGEVGMNIGQVDRGRIANLLAKLFPVVSGQRALLKEIFLSVPNRHLKGYGAEVALNFACGVNGGVAREFILEGVSVRKKFRKVGAFRGLIQYTKMFSVVVYRMVAVRLDRKAFMKRG
jgi:glycosyltransferase involved in cell wall biosynthesis